MQISLLMCIGDYSKVADCKPFAKSMHGNDEDVYCKSIHIKLVSCIQSKSSDYVY